MAAYHGKTGQVKMSTTGTGTPAIVALLSEWTLDMATDKAETTSFGATNKQYVQGLPDLKGSVTGFWDSANNTIFEAALSADGIQLELLPSELVPSVLFSGPAWLDASITVEVNGAVGIKGNFVANGSWILPGQVVATGATATTTPGKFTPAGASAPPNLAAMTGITASPATAWTTGQHVVLGDSTKAYWNGTAWTAGQAAVLAEGASAAA